MTVAEIMVHPILVPRMSSTAILSKPLVSQTVSWLAVVQKVEQGVC